MPAALERSRSGNGGHVWIFFEHAIPANTARKLGCALLTRTMERRHQLGLDSYDRFFPNQDTMPKGGFGNLIALPLQFAPRKSDNSVFIDASLRQYQDQWGFLSTIRRMSTIVAEEVIADAQRNGDLIGVRISNADDEDAQDPWTLPPSRRGMDRPIEGPLPETMQIVRANLLYVEKQGLPPAMLNRLLRLAAFQNPEFYKAQAMRLPTYAKPRVIGCGQDFPQHTFTILVIRFQSTQRLLATRRLGVRLFRSDRCRGCLFAENSWTEERASLHALLQRAGATISREFCILHANVQSTTTLADCRGRYAALQPPPRPNGAGSNDFPALSRSSRR